MVKRLKTLVFLAMCACPSKPASVDAGALKVEPKPLEALERVVAEGDAGGDEDPLYRVVPLPPMGPALPVGAVVVTFQDDRPMVGGAPLDLTKVSGPLVVDPKASFCAQAAAFFASADDAKVEVWLKHPDAPIAFRLKLRDEAAFQVWLDEPVPGKLRIIHREDGFELQTNLGKLPGGDPKGPTVPVRGGHLDLKTLQRGLERIQARFKSAPDYCYLPAHALDLAQTARAMAANYVSADTAYFPETCLVYHRPGSADAGH